MGPKRDNDDDLLPSQDKRHQFLKRHLIVDHARPTYRTVESKEIGRHHLTARDGISTPIVPKLKWVSPTFKLTTDNPPYAGYPTAREHPNFNRTTLILSGSFA